MIPVAPGRRPDPTLDPPRPHQRADPRRWRPLGEVGARPVGGRPRHGRPTAPPV